MNDISGLRYDPGLGEVVAAAGAALVLMHMRGTSREMYREASYADVAAEVRDELAASLAAAGRAGVARESIIVDPGLGFAKRAEHSYEALARLADLAALDRPILVGSSRKSFLTRALGDVAPSGSGLGHGRDRRRGDPRGGAHRPGSRGRADGPGGAGRRRNRESAEPVVTFAESILSVLRHFGWWDLLDVLIVAVLIYEILKLVRGTRAVQMALGAGLLVLAVLPVAVEPPRDAELAHPQHGRLPRVRPDRAVPGGHPARAGARRADAVRRLLRAHQAHRRDDRGDRRGRRAAVGPARRRHRGDRAQHRPAELHRGRHPARRDGHLRPARDHLPAGRAAARRGGHHPGRADCGRRVLPAADGESPGQQGLRNPAPRRDRADRGDRRGDGDRVGGNRSHLAGARRRHRERADGRRAAAAPARAADGPARAHRNRASCRTQTYQ